MLHYEFAQAWVQSRTEEPQRGASLVEYLIMVSAAAVFSLGAMAVMAALIGGKVGGISLG